MTGNMKQFLEEASKDREFVNRLTTAEASEEIIALAKEKGFTLTEADLKPDTGTGIQEVSDDEMSVVAGGEKCYCVAGGGGTETCENEGTCACIITGFGLYGDGDPRCGCFGYGEGI